MRKFNLFNHSSGQEEREITTSCLSLYSDLPLTCPLQPLHKMLILCMLLFAFGGMNVWGETVTYTTSSGSPAASGKTITGASASFSDATNQSNHTQMLANGYVELTLTSLGGINISNITLSMKSNSKAGAGTLKYSTDEGTNWTYLVGSASAGVDFNNASWHGAWSTSYIDVSKNVSLSNVTRLKIRVDATVKSLYCQSFTITYTPTASCSNKVNITKGTPETGGSFNLNKTGEQDCCSALTVTVSGITAPSGKRFRAITQSGINSGVTIDQNAKTVTYTANSSGNSTINVEFEDIPTHTVTWSANGNTSSENYQEGAAITFPKTATGCEGGTFMGWTANAIDGTRATAPTYVTSANMGNSDVTYYAVFATETAGAGGYEYIGDNTLLTANKTYIFVSSKSTGSAYALKASDLPSSNGNATGVSVSITSVGGKATIETTNTNLEFLCNSHTDDRDELEEVSNSGRLLVINGKGLGYAASGKAWYDEDGLHGCNSKCTTIYDVYHNGSNFIKAEGASYRVYAFIKKTTTYSNYRTSCCTPLAQVEGSANLSQWNAGVHIY